MFKVLDSKKVKLVKSANYHSYFNKETGLFVRYGATKEEDPEMCEIGPEILDMEISVNGCPNACPFCYKSNQNSEPTNMSFETCKAIIDKMPPTLTQIAFGITGVQTNPDFLRMMKYAREKGIIPNFTLSGIDLTEGLADEIAKVIGGCAVSAYQTDKDMCYDTVKMFTDRGIEQTNIHLMTSKETLPFVYEVLSDRLTDPRLAGMKAIIFLGVKPKGRAAGRYTPISQDEFDSILQYCWDHKIAIGFDSCTAPKYEDSIKHSGLSEEEKKAHIQHSESCESSLFSLYINVHGEVWPCSFTENEPGQEPIDVIAADDFVRDVWYNPALVKFRNRLLATSKDGCRSCPAFKV